MRRRLGRFLLVLLIVQACGSRPAHAAGAGAASRSATTAGPTAATRDGHPAPHRATLESAKASNARRDAAAPRAGAAKAVAAKRTLDEIHIEGEMPAPQVLFVTARAQRRFLESHHGHYLPTSLELAERTTLPSRFVVTRRPEARP